jgi:tripartite-type tricarboxylate transporter receptor subunit TctC
MGQQTNPAAGMRKANLLILLSSIALQLNAFAQPATNFYQGRTITILVGSGPGGTTDVTARVIARHLGKHIPGSPTVIVQNMPGGGSVTMTNHVYRAAPKNGTVLGYSLPGIVTAQLLEPQRTRYNAEELNWIGSALKYTGIVSVLDSAPATTIEQARETELFIGTTGRGSPAYQYPAMAKALLNLQLNLITGYSSTNEVLLAMDRDEVHGQSSSLQYWAITRPDWLTNERLVHLLYVGPRDSLGAADVPYLSDLVTSEKDKALAAFIATGSRVGWPLFAPPGTPRQQVESLRQAFSSLMANSAFAAELESTVRGPVIASSGAEIESLVRNALATPAEIVLETKNILGL